jgi:drug/metabolite transporter (DMT)-like permease
VTFVGPTLALAAAVLFGLSAPAAKILLGAMDPWLLAGLLYLASGVGLGAMLAARAAGGGTRETPLRRADAPWLGGAVITGGLVGPVLMMFGLMHTGAARAALLLNLEGVFTALLAWFVFREHFDARIAVGMTAIGAGALLLAWEPNAGLALDAGALLVAGASLAWAIDNNLTRRVSGGDPVQIAAIKGGVAGTINVLLAIAAGAAWPKAGAVAGAAVVGLLGYGTSLVLFVQALRRLGTGRTSAYFSTAPFVGAVAGVLTLGEPLTGRLAAAGVLMGLGVWLHLTEHHEHVHVHETLEHDHLHWNDEHHRHAHEAGTPPGEPHAHRHAHTALRHRHPHYPDLHHRHGH